MLKKRLQNSPQAIILYHRLSPLAGTAFFTQVFFCEISFCMLNCPDWSVTDVREAHKKDTIQSIEASCKTGYLFNLQAIIQCRCLGNSPVYVIQKHFMPPFRRIEMVNPWFRNLQTQRLRLQVDLFANEQWRSVTISIFNLSTRSIPGGKYSYF